jgi:hypothetical protein
MLTDTVLRDLLTAGHRTSDDEFVKNFVEHMSRTVFFMTEALAEHQYKFLDSIELQARIDSHLKRVNVRPSQGVFNPVDWFSAQWTESLTGEARPYFKEEYRELFQREGQAPIHYRIHPAQYDRVAAILSDLRSSEAANSDSTS